MLFVLLSIVAESFTVQPPSDRQTKYSGKNRTKKKERMTERQIKKSTYQKRKKLVRQYRKNIYKVVLKLFIEVILVQSISDVVENP